MVEERVKGLLQELGDVISETVTGSPRVEAIMQAIRDSGYEVYLMLEANIAVEDRRSRKEDTEAPAEKDFTADDRQFLKRLKIDA